MERKSDVERILVTQSTMPPFEEYTEMIRSLWDNHWLTNMGRYHKEFEQQLSEYLDVNYVSLTVNGHMALELAIQSMGFPEGAEVITTPYTFISTTHAILRNKLTPVFCDIKEDFTIDESKIEELITEKTVAILPVHVYGNVCNVEKIQEIAFKYDLKVIYDAAHAFGEKYKGKNVAAFGDFSIFSFHATKVFHSIEGGAVCCRNEEQWNRLYNLKNFGIRSQELCVAVGANAKMNEFQAAMGLCNLKYLSENIRKRENIVALYREKLGKSAQIQLNSYSEELEPNYAYFPVLFSSETLRNHIFQTLKNQDIYTRKYFYPITADEVCFRNKYRTVPLDRARDYSGRILVLPLYPDLAPEDAGRIAEIVLGETEK